MKIAAILANGAEELEVVAVTDVLRRLGAEVTLAGLDRTDISCANGCRLVADRLFAGCVSGDFDAVYLPGGTDGAMALYNSDAAVRFVQEVEQSGKVVAAICAAPIVLARAGLLSGRRFTMYPGFDEYLDGEVPTGEAVETDDRVVTGRGPGAVFAFAAKFAAALGLEKEVAELYKKMFVVL